MRILGLDLGTKRIGVALSDESATLAQGKEVILKKSKQHAVDRIAELVKEFNVKEIVVGHPLNMDGTSGERALESEKFAEELRKRLSISVKLWDERLSTKEAESILIEADLTRKKRKDVVDKLAAQIILQNYLDSL